MAIRHLIGGVHADDAMPHGFIRYDAEACQFFLTMDTYWIVSDRDVQEEVIDYATANGSGLWAIPRGLIASEVEIAVTTFAEPGPSTVCVFPPCGQDATDERRGFPLCSSHAAELADWDELVAAG